MDPQITEKQGMQNYAIPFAIVIAGLAIAAAIYFGNANKNAPYAPGATAGARATVDPIIAKDHIIGNPNAKVVVIEYSDLECPFCKMFHPTMGKIMTQYADQVSSGKLAWVYRQFPIASLHPKAHHEGEAAECANKLGGNTKFWDFINKIFEITPANNGLDPAQLPKVAGEIGLDVTAFNKCLDSGEMASAVDAGIASGTRAGITGTPYSIIMVSKVPVDGINGAQSFETVKAQIDSALK